MSSFTNEKSSEIINLLKQNNIDHSLALEILEKYNNGQIGNEEAIKASSLPGNESSINTSDSYFTFTKQEIESFEDRFKIKVDFDKQNSDIVIAKDKLHSIGTTLLPQTAYGVLNGGSATSYVDIKKNQSFNNAYFNDNKCLFDTLASEAHGKPKGITPAFINPDGTPGPSFMELKMRAVLLQIAAHKAKTGDSYNNPLFQMTSITNDSEIKKAYEEYKKSPYLTDLINYTGIDITEVKTAKQPLISAYTQDPRGDKKVFLGKDGSSPLALPGGHGQNFSILKPVYRELQSDGKIFAEIGNVDNLGNIPDSLSIALTALKNPNAAFEFSFKTAVDIKGGILVRDQNNHLNCADIGVAVSKEDVKAAEQSGKQILFNCATGMFDLDYLNCNIDSIINKLPVRFSDQDKDAGKYSQAEQVTWEVIGILDKVLILGVNKYHRFVAAKLLLESFLASGIGLDNISESDHVLKEVGTNLNKGLSYLLKHVYRLQLDNGKWQAIPANVIF